MSNKGSMVIQKNDYETMKAQAMKKFAGIPRIKVEDAWKTPHSGVGIGRLIDTEKGTSRLYIVEVNVRNKRRTGRVYLSKPFILS